MIQKKLKKLKKFKASVEVGYIDNDGNELLKNIYGIFI